MRTTLVALLFTIAGCDQRADLRPFAAAVFAHADQTPDTDPKTKLCAGGGDCDGKGFVGDQAGIRTDCPFCDIAWTTPEARPGDTGAPFHNRRRRWR